MKTLTLDQYIAYRNMLITRREARIKHFGYKDWNDKHVNYYTSRIEMLDQAYPQFKGLGHVILKNEEPKVSRNRYKRPWLKAKA